METHSSKPSFAQYLPFVLITVCWLVDAVIDWAFFSRVHAQSETVFSDGYTVSLHLLVFFAQLLFVVYVVRLVRGSARLKQSLEGVRRQSEEEKAKVESIMAAMVDPVSVQNTEFLILYQNQAHREMMGDRAGQYCYQAYVGNAAPCDGCHLLETFKTGIPQRREVAAPTASGERQVEILSSPMRDATGEIVAGIEVIRDITSRKRAEDEIRKLNADLEQRALDLAASYRELEAFSYSVSHDLRTPLTRIYSSVQALAEYRTTLDENGRFFVKTICEASEQMEELIEALISLSQVSSSEMKTEEVDLVPLAREIMADLLLCHPERSVRFSAPGEFTVTGDRQLLQVLLENLLGNAFKYTGKVPAASIELGSVARDNGVLCFVRDNGAGFDMKHAERLFKPFSRLHASHDFPGTGIGLATVQRIVNRHGGEVWAEGEVGKGASFYFTLK